jgi:hypothetical protein
MRLIAYKVRASERKQKLEEQELLFLIWSAGTRVQNFSTNVASSQMSD